jgi:SiaC family regulatory phosphoprotein
MKTTISEQITNTPSIIFDDEKGVLEIKGESDLENSGGYYKPIIDRIAEFVSEDKIKKVDFCLYYFNTNSSKDLLEILLVIKKGKKVDVNWYSDDDSEMKEEGEDLSTESGVPFNYVEGSI